MPLFTLAGSGDIHVLWTHSFILLVALSILMIEHKLSFYFKGNMKGFIIYTLNLKTNFF